MAEISCNLFPGWNTSTITVGENGRDLSVYTNKGFPYWGAINSTMTFNADANTRSSAWNAFAFLSGGPTQLGHRDGSLANRVSECAKGLDAPSARAVRAFARHLRGG